jgi:FixJ family two-component response regulator
MFHRGWFLVSAKDANVSADLARAVRSFGVAALEKLARSNLERVSSDNRWAGVIADGELAQQPLLIELRQRAPFLPMLALLGPSDVRGLNVLQAQQIEVMTYPYLDQNVIGFVQRALATGFIPDDRVARLVRRIAEEKDLTPREVQILTASLGDEPRERLRRRLGISENTLKTQVKGLLKKCAERNLDTLSKSLLRAALLYEQPAEDAFDQLASKSA